MSRWYSGIDCRQRLGVAAFPCELGHLVLGSLQIPWQGERSRAGGRSAKKVAPRAD
jgi:hypothetical protein